MGEPPNYEPDASDSVAAIAARANRPDEEVLYDLMMAHDGRELLMFALLGYTYGNLDAVREMIVHPATALGLSDGGAHVGAVCDASIPTFMLTHWARDRTVRPAAARAGGPQDHRSTPPGSTGSATAASSSPASRPTST